MSVLVACLGDAFRGDGAFGTKVFERLAARGRVPGAAVKDFGSRGLDFAYALLEPWDGVVIVDAAPRGRAPGTLYVLEPDPKEFSPGDGAAELEGRGMEPVKALRWAAAMGANLPAVRVVACEPA